MNTVDFSISKGQLLAARQSECSNYDDRPHDAEVSLLVVHCISLPPGQFGGEYISQLFANELDCGQHHYFRALSDLKVSAHVLIRRDGNVLQYVNFDHRAWHAGLSSYQGREACNDFSVGVELEGADDQPYEMDQYVALAQLAHSLIAYYPALSPARIVGHEDIAPGRKTDPGPLFSWALFREIYQNQAEVR